MTATDLNYYSQKSSRAAMIFGMVMRGLFGGLCRTRSPQDGECCGGSALRKLLEKGSELTIAGLGDSLTQGWMVNKGFFDRFCDRLSETYPQARIKRINAGVPGDTASGALYRLDRLIGESPDWAVVQFALNDCYSGVDLSEFERDLESITRKLLEKDIHPILVTSCPVLDAGFQKAVGRFYSAIAAVAGRLSVPVARLDRYWAKTGPAFSRPEALYQWDGVHPTDEGHAIMAEGLLKLVTGNETF